MTRDYVGGDEILPILRIKSNCRDRLLYDRRKIAISNVFIFQYLII